LAYAGKEDELSTVLPGDPFISSGSRRFSGRFTLDRDILSTQGRGKCYKGGRANWQGSRYVNHLAGSREKVYGRASGRRSPQKLKV